MTSNAYIATDGEQVMKVGKANDVRRREKQIAIPMTMTIACLDEAAAFRVESQLRDFVIEQGGIQHQGTIDWFRFDPQIYTMLCEFAISIEARLVGVDLDTEINQLRQRYYQLIADELFVQLAERDAEIERLRAEVQAERERAERAGQLSQQEIIALNRKVAVLEFQLEQLLDKEDDDE